MTNEVSSTESDNSGIGAAEPLLTLEDLVYAESEVLQRVARDHGNERAMAGHYSSTSGHKASSGHASHVSAKVENPLDG
jgi:hypothetical protein